MDKKICKVCMIEKPLNHFYKNITFKTGYESRCKICHNQGKKIFRGEPLPPKKAKYLMTWEQEFNIRNVKKEDYMLMYEFFEKIGYNRNNIHQQFCEKYNLTTRKRSSKNLNLFLPDGSRNKLSHNYEKKNK